MPVCLAGFVVGFGASGRRRRRFCTLVDMRMHAKQIKTKKPFLDLAPRSELVPKITFSGDSKTVSARSGCGESGGHFYQVKGAPKKRRSGSIQVDTESGSLSMARGCQRNSPSSNALAKSGRVTASSRVGRMSVYRPLEITTLTSLPLRSLPPPSQTPPFHNIPLLLHIPFNHG